MAIPRVRVLVSPSAAPGVPTVQTGVSSLPQYPHVNRQSSRASFRSASQTAASSQTAAGRCPKSPAISQTRFDVFHT